jgi:hypothetical protein
MNAPRKPARRRPVAATVIMVIAMCFFAGPAVPVPRRDVLQGLAVATRPVWPDATWSSAHRVIL